MLHDLLRIWFELVEAWGYVGVFLLMALESSIVPVPSEVVMPPAAFWAAQGKMSFAGVVIAGTLGSWFGSAISYWVAKAIGLRFLRRYGKYVLIDDEKLRLSEAWVLRFGTPGVFFARLLPVVRHLISIPAGIFSMPFWRFSVVTLVGAGLWCWVLAWFGREALGAHPELLQSPEAMISAVKAQLNWFIFGVVGFGVLYAVMMVLKSRLRSLSANVP